MIIKWLLRRLRSARPEQVFWFRCEGCGAISWNPISLQNHRAFACDRYMAYFDELTTLRKEYEARVAAAGALAFDVLLEYQSRLRALQALYVAGWDRDLKRATYRGPAVPLDASRAPM